MDKNTVKEIMRSLGADLCGIASMDRFDNAPQGYHPRDVMPACRSVISFGCRFPVGALLCTSHAPYTRVRNSITEKMDAIALDFCIEMERRGVPCAPVPTNEAEWDPRTGRSRSIISLKHAAQAAGLGTIGRHSLLITPEYGSMVWLGAVLCARELEPDALRERVCDGCGLCVKACPIDALRTVEMDQRACWDYAFGEDETSKSWRIACHRCRDACPHNLGSENRFADMSGLGPGVFLDKEAGFK